MEQCTIHNGPVSISTRDILTEILRSGAQKLLAETIENEVAEYIQAHSHRRDDDGYRLVVRNGHLPARTIRTGVGPVEIQQPRVNDKRIDEDGQRMHFSSKILPPYLRRTRSIDELIPWLYLKGIRTGDFTEERKEILGPHEKGLAENNSGRRKEAGKLESEEWANRSMTGKRYGYGWDDGIHFNVRLQDNGNDKKCIMAIMGAGEDRKKDLIEMNDG